MTKNTIINSIKGLYPMFDILNVEFAKDKRITEIAKPYINASWGLVLFFIEFQVPPLHLNHSLM